MAAGLDRQVVLVDCSADARIFAFEASILAPHDSLQLGKLVNHPCLQVALGQQRRPLGQLPDRWIEALGQAHRQFAKAHHLLVAGPQPGLVNNVFERLETTLELDLLIFRPEEHGIGEPGAQHPFVAPRHHLRVVDPGIGNSDEARQQTAVLAGQGEVALVLAHGGDQQFSGKRQVFLLEGAADRAGVLHQKGDFFEQLLVEVDLAADGMGRPLDLPGDHHLALLRIGNDEMALRLLQPVFQAAHGKRPGRHEAVAVREVAAFDVAEAERDNEAVIESDQPMNRPGEADIQVLPAHRLLEGDAGNDPRQHLRQQVGGRPPLLHFGDENVRPLVGLRGGELRHLDPIGPGEAESGLGRVAVSVEGNFDRRAGYRQFLTLLKTSHIGHGDGDPARRRESADGTEADAGKLQLLAQQTLQVGHGDGQKTGRNLLGAYFQKQFSGHKSSKKVVRIQKSEYRRKSESL